MRTTAPERQRRTAPAGCGRQWWMGSRPRTAQREAVSGTESVRRVVRGMRRGLRGRALPLSRARGRAGDRDVGRPDRIRRRAAAAARAGPRGVTRGLRGSDPFRVRPRFTGCSGRFRRGLAPALLSCPRAERTDTNTGRSDASRRAAPSGSACRGRGRGRRTTAPRGRTFRARGGAQARHIADAASAHGGPALPPLASLAAAGGARVRLQAARRVRARGCSGKARGGGERDQAEAGCRASV